MSLQKWKDWKMIYIYIDYISNDTNLNNISDLAKFISNRITSCEVRRTIWKLLHDK